ncbi:MAG: tRNA pseudouridine(55) synthase TruB [Clostridia bacterium]|nr:tRNA pseudouridine(55) synthase TruB [Clostridia bacterium]
MSGVLNVYKPPGISSAYVVGKVKRILNTRAVGHMGTLDPMGEGVLLMGVGKGTRLFDYYLSKSKTYEASFKFGIMTDTIDATGTDTSRTENIPTEEEIEAVLPSLLGECDQIPPLYSAKSVGGVRAYKLARAGQTVELKPARVTINSIEKIEKIGENEYMFRIDCSSGTYIRSICRDLAEKLGSLAIMTSIKRTRCGNFFVDKSVELEKLSEADVTPLEEALLALPRYDADDAYYKKVINGVPLEVVDAPAGRFTLYCKNELIGIAENSERGIRIKTYLKEG